MESPAKKSEEAKTAADNNGLLLASGFVAGESLTAVLLAVFVFLKVNFTKSPVFDFATEVANRHRRQLVQRADCNGFSWVMPWLGLIIFVTIAWVLIRTAQPRKRPGGQRADGLI